MPATYQTYSNSGQTTFSVTYPYIKKSHVKVYKGRDIVANTQTATLVEGVDYNFSGSGTQIILTSALGSGEVLTIERDTPTGAQLSPWSDGSNLTAEELNTSDLQNLYAVQELKDENSLGAVEARNATTAANNATVAANAANAAANALTSSLTSVTNTANGALQRSGGTMSGDINTDGNKITNLPTPSGASEPVIKSYLEAQTWNKTTESILNAETWPTASDATIASTYAIDSRINSKIDTALTTDVGAGDCIAITDNSPSTGQIEIKVADGSVTDAKLAAGINGSKLSNASVQNVALALGIDGAKITNGTLPFDKLEPAAIVLSTESVTANNTSIFTTLASDNRYFRQDSSETISSGNTWSAGDTHIATTAAIDARIVDLVDQVGGFVPITNETSFPDANPDPNNSTGTIVSIKALANDLTSNGSGVATISNGNVSNGETITINGLAANTTYAATFGMLVETGGTTHTYTFHRLTPKATEVTTVAGSVVAIQNLANIDSDVSTVAGISSAVSTVSGISSAVSTVSGISSNVSTVAGISSDVTAVANDATDIGAVAAKATEIGRLGTADAVADLNTLGTAAIVSDLDTCATNVSDITTVSNAISNVNAVGSNISNVNAFAARYRVASSDPTSNNDQGDLVFNTTTNELRVYNGGSWQGGVTATGNLAGLGANTFTGLQTFASNQTFDGRDVSADGAKLDAIEVNATQDQTAAEIRVLVDQATNSNVYTDVEKTKLSGIASGAEVNVNADWSATSGDAQILNKPTLLQRVDEDDMVSNSATLVPSQQSVRAFVETKVASAGVSYATLLKHF